MSFFEYYPLYEYRLAATQLVLTMLGVGATLGFRDFVLLMRKPRPVGVGIFAQLLLVPGLAGLLVFLFPLNTGVAVGLFLVAAMPGGAFSNIAVFLGRGNVALSITLTTIMTFAALFTTPFILGLLAAEFLPADFRMPIGHVVREIVLILLLPLGAGMLIGRMFPRIRVPFSNWCVRIVLVIIGIIVVGSLGSGRIEVHAYGWGPPLLLTAFCIGSMVISRLISRATRLPMGDAYAVGIEVTIRNVNLALLLAVSLFPAGRDDGGLSSGVLYSVLFYGGVAILVAIPQVVVNRRRALRAVPAEPRPLERIP